MQINFVTVTVLNAKSQFVIASTNTHAYYKPHNNSKNTKLLKQWSYKYKHMLIATNDKWVYCMVAVKVIDY